MDVRQLKIQDLVMEYFRTRTDTGLEPGLGGKFLLTLKSPAALAQFGGNDETTITFDEESAFQNPDWNLINATHPFLEVIRNDLASVETEDPRLTEAYFAPQPISPKGRVAVPGIEIDGPIVDVEYKNDYEPHFVLTYKVVFESDERQDYVLRLCFDARTCERRHIVVRQLRRLPLQNGRPESVDRGSLHNIEEILLRGRVELELRVQSEVAATAEQISDRLTNERERLKKHYEGEISRTNKRDEDGRRRLRENLRKEIEDFEKKYTFRSRIYLTSVLLLWTPRLSYRLEAQARSRRFFVDGITYDAATDIVAFQKCERCGNKRRFVICCAGKHAFCGDSSCATKERCLTCSDLYCSLHGDRCSHCSEPCCFEHKKPCGYGSHPEDAGFCPRCLKSSFEQELICIDCATVCELCVRTFPRDLIASCHVGHEKFCLRHHNKPDGAFCSECGEPVCKKHGRETDDKKYACVSHSHEATCCHKVFGDSRLTTCVVDQAELLCDTHRIQCVVGHEATCEKHAVNSWQGESLCALHCDHCVRCNEESVSRIYRTDKLTECIICFGKVCTDHIERCQVCSAHEFCRTHRGELTACSSCSRISCASNECSVRSATCKLCKMSYCRHCLTKKGVCTTCSRPESTGRASQAFPLLEALSQTSDVSLQKASGVMMKSFTKCRVLTSENATYRVVVVHFKPSPWAFWQKEQQLRIVADHQGKVVKALLERPN